MHYPSSSRFAVSSGLRTATSAFPVLSLPPDLSASAAGYATVLPVRVTRYHQPRVARDDGRRGVPRRGLSLLGWTVPTTTPEDRAEPATEVKHPPSFRFITPLSLRTPRQTGGQSISGQHSKCFHKSHVPKNVVPLGFCNGQAPFPNPRQALGENGWAG
jgi:hypothetical protein